MHVLLAIIATALLLIVNETWSRRRNPHGELSRKFIHISVGCLVASWPFWLSWTEIRWLSLAFLIGVVISKQLRVFQAIHSVQRPTWGEFFFAIAVGGLTFITSNGWIYAAALLQMSLADGLAAVLGVKYGNGQAYTVFHHKKSLVGTVTFLVVSIAILTWYVTTGDAQLGWLHLMGISLLAMVIENLAVAGLDNLLVPVVVAALLR